MSTARLATAADPLGLSVTEAAEVLGLARHTLSRVLNGHAAISPDMAIRLEKAGWSNADFWLRRQSRVLAGHDPIRNFRLFRRKC